MGGFGSGRRLGDKAKRTTGSFPSLDVRRLCRGRRLRPGLSFVYEWTRYGQKAAAVEIEAEPDQVTLLYCYRRPTGEIQEMRCPVQLEWSACHYGGRRVWFRCPREGCGRRVAILYGEATFACRRCHRLTYRTQRASASSRSLGRAQAIRQRLGGTANMFVPFPPKAERNALADLRKLRREHNNAEANSWPRWFLRR